MRLLSLSSNLQPLVALVAAALVLTAPLLHGETLCTDDGALHVYRTVALDRAVRDGLLFPRWFPDLAYGYGFPFFVYREPLGYYTLEALHLIGLSIPNALNLTLAGSVVLSGLAMFWLARDIFGERSGLLAGMAYLTAPYLLIGPIVRGNLPEVIALALMPLILFCFRRLIVARRTRWLVASIVSYAALFLTHNISSLLFTPLLLAYAAVLGWARMADGSIHPGRSAIRPLLRPVLAMALAFGLTAFFWLPALTESDQAQLYLTHSARGNDYHYNFINLDELLGGPGQSDPNLLNPPPRIVFGWPQLALAGLGVLSYRRATNREQRATILAAAVATVALTFMALPASLPAWDHLPLIRFVQFPWRFVGRAMLPAALLAGAILSTRNIINHEDTKTPRNLGVSPAPPLRGSARPVRRVAAGVRQAGAGVAPSWLFTFTAFVALLFTAPLAYPRVCPTPHELDINDVFAYERATGHIGVDPLGAYLPASVLERPTGSPLEAQYAAGQAIERFDKTALPAGAGVVEATYGPNRADLTISTPTAFTATYLAFAFPGWQVWIDDRPVDVRPSQPTGLITFDVPAGDHRLRVAFGESPPRALADGLSLMALLATAATIALARTKFQHASRFTFHVSRFSLQVFIALVGFVLVKATLIDAGLTPLRSTRLQAGALAGISHPLDVAFGDRLRLLGYDARPSQTRPGEIIRVDLYWQAVRPLDAAYQAEVFLVDAGGWLWSPKHADRPRDFTDYPATSLWPTESYAIDSFEVEVLPGTPPGEYALAAQVFDRATLAPLQPSGAALPGRLAAPLGSIGVERASRAFDADRLRIYGGERHELDDDLTLLGYNIDRGDSVPGEGVLLTFFWQADRAPQSDRRFRVELIDAQGASLASQEIVIGGDGYSTAKWIAGEQIISLVTLRVPASAPSGAYRWRASLLGESTADTIEMQPSFHVAAPERTFSAPEMAHEVSVEIGDWATLLGFDLASDWVSPGEAIELTLYWQARAETTTAYKVFVHILDAGGRIAAQADAVPVNATRPTTGWLPGEVVADRYAITLPGDLASGEYRIAAGMYDAETSSRLRTSAGGDSIALATVRLK